MRQEYAQHMAKLLRPGAHLLLITMQYADGVLTGPPFSVTEAEVCTLFDAHFTIDRRGIWDAEGPRGVAVKETVLLLTRRDTPM